MQDDSDNVVDLGERLLAGLKHARAVADEIPQEGRRGGELMVHHRNVAGRRWPEEEEARAREKAVRARIVRALRHRIVVSSTYR